VAYCDTRLFESNNHFFKYKVCGATKWTIAKVTMTTSWVEISPTQSGTATHLDRNNTGRKLTIHRLDAQHLLWKLHNRYTLHPAISKSDHMKIAEVGTGTGYVHLKATESPIKRTT
jgi:hypothetical protein